LHKSSGVGKLDVSVFTKEDTSNVLTSDDLWNKIRSTDRLEDIIIKPETIAAKLEKLRLDKAAGDVTCHHVY